MNASLRKFGNILILILVMPLLPGILSLHAQSNDKPVYSVDKWYDAAQILYQSENYTLAAKLMTFATEKDSSQSRFWILRGDCYTALGNLPSAMLDYGKAILLNPQDACTMYKLAGLYVDIGDSEATLLALDRAILVNPIMPEYFNLRGEVYFKQKKWEAALADFSRAIELDPKQRRYWINRADTYTALENKGLAESDYTSALKIGAEQ